MIPRFHFHYSPADLFFAVLNSVPGRHSKPESLDGYFGNHVLPVSSARVGLRLSLSALGLPSDSTVGIQPFTCSSVLHAIARAGYKCQFIDIDENLKLSIHDLEKKAQLIDALIVTHTFGFPEDIRFISRLTDKPIIEDCAQALYSESNLKPLGLDGKAGVFSTGYGKLMGLGTGAIIVTSDPEFCKILETNLQGLKSPGFSKSLAVSLKAFLLSILHLHIIYTLITYPLKKRIATGKEKKQNYPDTEFKAFQEYSAGLKRNFAGNARRAEKQKQNGRMLLEWIDKRFHHPFIKSGEDPNFFLVPVRCKRQDELISYLKQRGIEAAKHFSGSVEWVADFGYKQGSCPVFERIASEIVTIPCHYNLSKRQIKKIANAINSFK